MTQSRMSTPGGGAFRSLSETDLMWADAALSQVRGELDGANEVSSTKRAMGQRIVELNLQTRLERSREKMKRDGETKATMAVPENEGKHSRFGGTFLEAMGLWNKFEVKTIHVPSAIVSQVPRFRCQSQAFVWVCSSWLVHPTTRFMDLNLNKIRNIMRIH
ncbi:hypothetical protein C8J56DRAFT_1076656 [Mycena floridula]|nr:hypothetical protein C8J56DRAFT_1076656 [Mycena floridula]